MAFPSSTGTKQDSLAKAWETARAVAAGIKQRGESLRAASAAGPIQVGGILDYATYLADQRLTLAKVAALSGIGAYAQDQIADPAINVATEFSGIMTTLDSTISWIIANFPKDGGGWLLATNFNPDNSGRTQWRTLSTAQTAGLRTALEALIAAID